MSIPFTQYLRPDGRKQQITIDRPVEIEELARRLIVCGYRFEIEVLTTGEVSMEVLKDRPDPDCTDSLGLELCQNGPSIPGQPGVPETVDKLITEAAAALVTGCSPGEEVPDSSDAIAHGDNCGCKSFDDCPAREPEEDCSPPFGE